MSDKFREKLFFFVAEDWIRYRLVDTQTQAVPTALDAHGQFQRTAGSPIPGTKAGTVIYDPATCPSVGAASCTPFPGNIIPHEQAQPERHRHSQRLPGAYARVSQRNAKLARHGRAPDQSAQGHGEHRHSSRREKHHISGRRTDASYFEYQPFDQGSGLTGKYFNRPEPDQHRVVDLDHQPDADQRSPRDLQPGRRLHPGEHGAGRLQSQSSSASTIPT